MLKLDAQDKTLVVVDVPKGERLYYWSCSGAFGLEKRLGAGWKSLRDDSPSAAMHDGYYLDDVYIEPAWNLGCDVVGCVPYDDPQPVARAVEYVQVGTAAPPEDAPANAAPNAPRITSVPVVGLVRAKLEYSTKPDCADSRTATLETAIPGGFVCCPVGSTGCSSEGPGGGSAPSLDSCPIWDPAFDVAYRIGHDDNGCEILVEDTDACCGCVDADAGL